MKMLLNRSNILRTSFYRDYPHKVRNRGVSHMYSSRPFTLDGRNVGIAGCAASTIHLGFFSYDSSFSFGSIHPSRLKESGYFSFYHYLYETAFGF